MESLLSAVLAFGLVFIVIAGCALVALGVWTLWRDL